MKPWLLALLFVPILPAYAAPGDLCFEDIDDMCGLLAGNPQEVFASIMEPLDSQFQLGGVGAGLVILWGGLLGVIWFKTENVMLLGIVGIVVSTTIVGLPTEAQGIGMLLLAVSIGILLFQLIRQRPTLFS